MAKTHDKLGIGEAARATKRSAFFSKPGTRVKQVDKRTWMAERRLRLAFALSAKTTRIACNITQRAVARHYGVQISTVARWESGAYAWPGGEQELFEHLKVLKSLA